MLGLAPAHLGGSRGIQVDVKVLWQRNKNFCPLQLVSQIQFDSDLTYVMLKASIPLT